MRRGILIGCGGLLGLVVLLVIIGAIIGGGQEKEDTAEQPEPQKEEAKKGTQTASIGESVQVEDATWVVTNARQTNQLTDQFGGVLPPKQGNFVIVDFNFRNDGNDAKTLHQAAINLFDGSGRESSPDTDALGYIPRDKNIFLEQVNPGVTQDGQVVFTVDPNASDFELELRDTNLFSANKARVALGF